MNSFSHPLSASVFTTVWPRLRRGDGDIRWRVIPKTALPEQPLTRDTANDSALFVPLTILLDHGNVVNDGLTDSTGLCSDVHVCVI